MATKTTDRNKALFALIALVVAITAGGLYYLYRQRPSDSQPPQTASQTSADSSEAATSPQGFRAVVDYDQMQSDEALKAQMDERKAALGVDEGVDFVVRPGESFKVGGNTVPMEEILDKIRLKTGEIGENDLLAGSGVGPDGSLTSQHAADLKAREAHLEAVLQQADKQVSSQQKADFGKELDHIRKVLEMDQALKSSQSELETVKQQLTTAAPDKKAALEARRKELMRETVSLKTNLHKAINEGRIDAYGIYVVRPGDNIWDIHFKFLKDYFSNRGVTLPPRADEPLPSGASSGVGKLLKFSENMVYIYNLRERKIDVDLDSIQPLSKIVVFKLDSVFALLGTIDYDDVNKIQFDGETLWVPAKG
jgi:hypothetical protein